METTREDLELELSYWQQEAANLQRQLVRSQIKLNQLAQTHTQEQGTEVASETDTLKEK